jgi:hypothetical protein
MTRLYTAIFLVLSLLLSFGCSSIPSGTERIADLQKNGAARIGQSVVIVGMADNKTPLSSFRIIKVYQNEDFIWVVLPEGAEEPPQGMNIRVAGTFQQKEFSVIGKVFCIEATKITME